MAVRKRRYMLDDGHGMSTPGKRTDRFKDGTKSSETGKDFMHENEFNREVVNYLGMHLKASGIDVFYSAPGDSDVPLATRTRLSDQLAIDVFLSVHANALTGIFGKGGRGIETFVYMGGSGVSENLGRIIHREVMKGTSMVDRGVKNGNHLWVIKSPRAASILLELGFMDDLREAKLLLSDAYRRECAEEIARGICSFEKKTFVNGVVVQASAPSKDLYRVRETWANVDSQAGAFSDLQNAKDLADQKGLSVFDDDGREVYSASKNTAKELYRVRKTWTDVKSQAGAFYELEGAKDLADQKLLTVFNEAGKSVYVGKKPEGETPLPTPPPVTSEPEVVNPVPEPVVDVSGYTPILGVSVATAKQLAGFLKAQNPKFVDADKVAEAFINVGKKYGVRGDIAFCQSIIETGWFRFEGGTAVTPDQHNYCGLGVTSMGLKGNSFDSIEDGVTAQIQHLFAYGSKAALPAGERLLDPRFALVSPRGKAMHWEELSMKWAMNANYGTHILSVYNEAVIFMPKEEVVESVTNNPAFTEEEIAEIIKDFPEYAKFHSAIAIREGVTSGERPDDMIKRVDSFVIAGRILEQLRKTQLEIEARVTKEIAFLREELDRSRLD